MKPPRRGLFPARWRQGGASLVYGEREAFEERFSPLSPDALLERGDRFAQETMVIEDRDCVARVLAGELEFFEALVHKYTRLGGAIAFGILGDFQLAEDVIQEAFFKAFRSLSALKNRSKFRAWFSGIVRSVALDVLRRRRSHGDVKANDRSGERLSEVAAREPSPLEQQIQYEMRHKVLESVQQLPKDDRLVIVLKYMEGLSYKEVAEAAGTTVSAVESRLFRARQVLKSKLMKAI